MTAFEQAKRRYLEGKFADLYVGQFDEMKDLTNDQLEDLVDELTNAQNQGRLDLETEAGLTLLNEIVDGYLGKEQ